MSITIRVSQGTKLFSEYIHSIYTPTESSGARYSRYFVLRIAIFVALYYGFEFWARRAALIPFASYFQPVLVLELVRHLSSVIPLVGLGLLAIIGIAARTALFDRWDSFDYGKQLRLLICMVVFVTAWGYSTYSYNFYFNQGHYIDRLALVALLVLTCWRPVFVVPYTILLMTIIAQFSYPLANQDSLWVSVNLLVHALQLFSVFFVLYLVTGTRQTGDFIFVLCCLVSASYFRSGVGKLQLGWLDHPNLHLMLLGSYSYGWLNTLPPDQVISMTQFASHISIPLMIFTLVVELGALIYMAHRRLMLLFLLLFLAFHAGIAAMSGLFFWHYMALEIALLIFFYRTRSKPITLHSRWHFVLSVMLIGGGFIWFRSVNLAWFDTPLHYSYRYEAITPSGRIFMLPNDLFAPYSDVFTFQNFNFLGDNIQLTGPYGVTQNPGIVEDLSNINNAAEVLLLEDKYVIESYSQAHTAQLTDLVARFIGNLNQYREQNPSWWLFLQAPDELLSFPRPNEHWDGSEPIEKVIVYQYTSFFDGETYSEIRQSIVLEIPIPTST
jgi:hypothetical protein